MKKAALLALFALPFAFTQAQAGEFSTEPAATAYWEIPLGVTKTGKTQQAFGFRMDQVVRDNAGNLVSSFSGATRAPVVDFRFNASGMQGVYVRGVNMATPAIMKAAEGGDNTVWWIVGGTALAMTALIVEANDDGGSSGGNNKCVIVPGFALNADCPAPSFAGYGLNGASSCCPI